MTGVLVRKLLRDVRLPLVVVALFLGAFEALWVKIAERLSGHLLPLLRWLAAGRDLIPQQVEEEIFRGPGQIIRTVIGGERVSIFHPGDLFSVALVHPLVVTTLCVWAIGRAAGALTGEIDRGTMDLLLAQPVPRSRLVLAHLCVDLVVIPVLCLSLWAGQWFGGWAVGVLAVAAPRDNSALRLDPLAFAPALPTVAALLFAVSGYTMWLSAGGRYRGRVLSAAVLLTLVQSLVNVIGQLWTVIEPLRPLTVLYYYQPQAVILREDWYTDPEAWLRLVVLLGVGAVGYLMALRVFCRRDLPAPL
jgi:ABC-2 type transport system permease protein